MENETGSGTLSAKLPNEDKLVKELAERIREVSGKVTNSYKTAKAAIDFLRLYLRQE